MTNTRRLSAEIRQREQSRTAFAAGLPTPEQYLDALHDLDVAGEEIERQTARGDRAESYIANELCDIRLDNEANVAEIFRLKAQLAERTEDVIVLSDKLKFTEMDNYAKDSAIDDLSQRIKDQAQKITQQSTQIAALRENLLIYAPGKLGEYLVRDTAQLAADHDAAVRADERRKVLEEAAQVTEAVTEALYDFTFWDDPFSGIAARLRALAAQPEEAGEG